MCSFTCLTLTVTLFVELDDYLELAYSNEPDDFDENGVSLWHHSWDAPAVTEHTFESVLDALCWVHSNLTRWNYWCLSGDTTSTALSSTWPRWFGPEPAPVRPTRPRRPLTSVPS